MHLTDRSYLLLAATAALAITAAWSSDVLLAGLWRLPALLLLAGLALEGVLVRRVRIGAAVEIAPRCFLGRPVAAALVLTHSGSRSLAVQYAPLVPAGFEPLEGPRELRAAAGGAAREQWLLHPVRLGPQSWPALPARLLGRLELAWWSRELSIGRELCIAPDTLGAARRAGALAGGQRVRLVAGAGSELLQLRDYLPGDPLSRIDWKASARAASLVTREYSEDQHLDILVALDAGRTSRARAGALDRLGLYANIAARFAEHAVRHDDRIGLCVFTDRVLHQLVPARGLPAVMRLRGVLESLSSEAAESDVLAAAARIRTLLSRRSLIVLLTDVEEMGQSDDLPRAIRLLAPAHLALVAAARDPDIAGLAAAPARGWRDPWVSLAAAEHEARTRARIAQLRALGAPVVAAREDLLEAAVVGEYERLRRRRLI